MAHQKDEEDPRFGITGSNPHAPMQHLAESLGDYKQRRPLLARAVAWTFLFIFLAGVAFSVLQSLRI